MTDPQQRQESNEPPNLPSTGSSSTGNSTSTGTSILQPLAVLSQHESLEWKRRDNVQEQTRHLRHLNDFKFLKELGRGGYGRVYQVQNRVDSRIYALKTIRLNQHDETSTKSVLREVQALSGMNSSSVVRYYSAWVEKGHANPLDADDDEEEHSQSDDWTTNTASKQNSSTIEETSARTTTQSNHTICHLCQCSYQDWEVSFEHWGLIDTVLQPMNLCVSCYKQSIPSHVDMNRIVIRYQQESDNTRRPLQDYLFILMEYCETTLSEALEICRRSNNNDDDDNDDNNNNNYYYYLNR
mmetsp:Transcript_30882/g.72497  ORF Transcript_30882/g.72497 Transcript_30882/m.72497 type:complete len:297 (+) Transcript_30882:72-962(+)